MADHRSADLKDTSLLGRFIVIGGAASGAVGAVVGLIIGLNVHAPTAWFAVFEIGVPAAILGAVLGLVLGGAVHVSRGMIRRLQ